MSLSRSSRAVEDPETDLEQFLQKPSIGTPDEPQDTIQQKKDQAWLAAFINSNISNLEKSEKYSWFRDLRQLAHQKDVGNYIAKILIDQKYESPWISGAWEALSEANMEISEFESAVSHHLPNCVHRYPHMHANQPSKEASLELIEGKRAQSISTTDLLLGFAGYAPNVARDIDKESLGLQSMIDLKSHIKIENSSATVCYLDKTESDSSEKSQILLKKTIFSMNRLLLAIRKYQASNLCCNRMIFLKKRVGYSTATNAFLETVAVQFEDVFKLAEALHACEKNLFSQPDPQSPNNAQNILGTGNAVAVAAAVGLDPVIFLMATATAATAATAATGAGAVYNEQERQHNETNRKRKSAVEKLQRAAVSILVNLEAGYRDVFELDLSEISDLDLPVSNRARNVHQVLGTGALATQFFCLAFQLYVRRITGPLDFLFLDRALEQITLVGGERSPFQRRAIFVSLQKLTCLDQMIKGPVFYFSGPDNMYAGQTLDLVSTPEHLVDMWGTASFLHDNFSKKILSISIGGGVLHPTDRDRNSPWHWSTLKEYAKEMDKNPPEISIDIDERIRIGHITRNANCHLQIMDAQKCMQHRMQPDLEYLSTYPDFWAPKTIQGTFQVGQYVQVQGTYGVERQPGLMLKHALLGPQSLELLNGLSNYWGVKVSLCTSVAQRVPLREIVAMCLKPVLADNPPDIHNWSGKMERLDLVNMLQTSDYERWRNQDGDNITTKVQKLVDATFVRDVTSRVLNHLHLTGVRRETGDKFRIGWVLPNNPTRCVDIPTSGGNLWARMLADSPSQATFACMTSECFQSPSQDHRCQNKRPETWNFKRKLQFSTKVRAYTLTLGTYRNPCGLVVGKAYWIGSTKAMLLAEVTQESSGEKHLLVRGTKLPIMIIKRLIERPWIKEINDDAAEACLISSDQ